MKDHYTRQYRRNLNAIAKGLLRKKVFVGSAKKD
jgi:hypothetical protein